jgi:hypothetical protein
MRFDQSRTKLDLVTENTEQLSLEFEDEKKPVYSPAHARQLVLLHSGTPGDGLKQILVGAPYFSGVNGLSWAWLEEFADNGKTTLAGEVDDLRRWTDETDLPELVVRLRSISEQASADGSVTA